MGGNITARARFAASPGFGAEVRLTPMWNDCDNRIRGKIRMSDDGCQMPARGGPVDQAALRRNGLARDS
jgi:hypothetical protein